MRTPKSNGKEKRLVAAGMLAQHGGGKVCDMTIPVSRIRNIVRFGHRSFIRTPLTLVWLGLIVKNCVGRMCPLEKYFVDRPRATIFRFAHVVENLPNVLTEITMVLGVTFERAYCQQSVCNPSRSSFLTGLRPNTVKVDDLRKYFRDTAKGGSTLITLPQYFKNHGYFCQDIGKIFHNMGETKDRRSWSIDEVLFEGTHAADTIFYNKAQPDQGKRRSYKAPVTEAHDVPDTAYRDGHIANLAAAMLREHASSDQPFFLAVGFWRPHLPFVAPKKYWDLYDPEKISMPNPIAAPTDVPAIALHQSREIRGYGLTPKDRPFTEKEIRHYRHGYYAAISNGTRASSSKFDVFPQRECSPM